MEAEVGRFIYKFSQISFCHSPGQERWRPAINAYRCEHGFRICVDLAGVEKDSIELDIESTRVSIRGERELPEPSGSDQPVQVLAMEIDHGPFAREIELPARVDVEKATAEQKNGLLWITLPLAAHS